MKPTHTQTPSPVTVSLQAGGFTLIELMVVITLITILVAVGSTAAIRAFSAAAAQQTRILLAGAKGVADAYESATTQSVDPTDNFPINWSSSSFVPPIDDSIERFVWAAMQHPTTLKMLDALGDDYLVDDDGDGYTELVDGWGRRLKYFEANGPAGDPTLPAHGQPFFASPGQDGRWGDFGAANGSVEKKQASDNLYSFELEG